MKKIVVFLPMFILMLTSCVFAYTIVGDTVTYKNEYGEINVTPVTSNELVQHTQYAKLTSYLSGTQDIDFAFMFDDTITGRIWLWQNISHTTIHSESECNPYNTTVTNETVTDEVVEISNCTYSTYNTTEYYFDWSDKTSLMTHDTYNGKHFYWIDDVPFTQYQTKEVKWTYNTQPNTDGKWELWIKRSSETIAEALSSGYYVHLDPFWNSSFTYRHNITITNSYSKAVLDYIFTYEFNSSVLIANGDMQPDCDDARFLNANNEMFDFYLDPDTCNTTKTVAYIGLDVLPVGDTLIWLYSGNDSVSSLSTTGTFANYTWVSHMETADNNVTKDDSPNGWDGEARNGIEIVEGKYGSGYKFDTPSKTYVYVPHAVPDVDSLYGMADFWVKPSDPYGYWDGHSPSQAIQYADGDYTFRIWGIETILGRMLFDPSGNDPPYLATYVNLTNDWYHIQMLYNKTHYRIYINGVLNASAVRSISNVNHISTAMWIGSTNGVTNVLNATLDEYRVRDNIAWVDNSTHTLVAPDDQITYIVVYEALITVLNITSYANISASYDPISNSTTTINFVFNVTQGDYALDSGRAETCNDVYGCFYWFPCTTADNISYSCTMYMFYQFTAGEWTVVMEVNDTSGAIVNKTTTFNYTTLVDFIINPSVSFGNVNVGDINATTGVWRIWNTGNADLNMSIQGADLIGQTDGAYIIGIGNLSVKKPTDENQTQEAPLQLTTSSQRYPTELIATGFQAYDWVEYYLNVPLALIGQLYQGTWIWTGVEA